MTRFVIDKGDGTLVMNDLSHKPSFEADSDREQEKLDEFKKAAKQLGFGIDLYFVREMTDYEKAQWEME